MPIFYDQTGRTITMNKTPERIISLIPSQTEVLYDLGLDKEVVGITKFCVHPEIWFKTKTRVGGTKQLKMETIHQLKPDLIFANKEENVKEQVEELEKNYPVWISQEMDFNFSQLQTPSDRDVRGGIKYKPQTAYLIWQNPYMTAGGDTFIHAMMEAAGFENIFADKFRYPEITLEELSIADCQLLLLSSEPFPFKQKHIKELKPHLPNTKIILVDGEMFSWYGSRLIHAPGYFKTLRKTISEN